jgi:MFS family permease
MAWRFVQALGASPGLAVGAGVIGDIYKLEERGTAMGIFFAVSF